MVFNDIIIIGGLGYMIILVSVQKQFIIILRNYMIRKKNPGD